MNIAEYKIDLLKKTQVKNYLNNTSFDNDKVTIITTCFNAEKTIEKTIRSVIKQTYDNIEYFIIDANSTDDTKKIVNKYSDKISLILSETDHGPSDGINKGIALSTGGFIFYLAADDWIDKDFIKTSKELLAKSKYHFIFGNLILVDNINGEFSYRFSSRNYTKNLKFNLTNICTPCILYRKSCFENICLFSIKYRIACDYDLLLRFSKNKIFGFYNKNLYVFHRLGGLSSSYFYKAIFEELIISYKNEGFSFLSLFFFFIKFIKRSCKNLILFFLPKIIHKPILEKYYFLKKYIK